MSDFSEICPLFSTGMFNEVVFPSVALTHITACGNALMGTVVLDGVITKLGSGFKFGRTVIVTGAFARQKDKVTAIQSVWLVHHTSLLAAGTAFASYNADLTATVENCTYGVFVFPAEKTFVSSDVLGISVGTVTEDGGGVYDFIIRYKEK